jgi:phosphopantothenoylcysteine synthetase/decarboxylase
MQLEKWKPIKGYEDAYMVSNFGQVKSKEKSVSIGNGATRFFPEKIMKLTNQDSGSNYLRIALYKNQKGKLYSVHRLVADAFCKNPLNNNIVMHLDDNPSNNHATNLKWGTYSENNKGRNQYTICN